MDLDISDNSIGNEGADIISECINENQLGYIKKLNLSNCKIDFNSFYNIIVSLESNKRLEVLNFSKNNLYSDKFSSLIPYFTNSNLKDLQLSKCKLGNKACKYKISSILSFYNFIKK
jgi:Ran GTPase-activating protein (RanGAP) involved in mRNA processing and transport